MVEAVCKDKSALLTIPGMLIVGVASISSEKVAVIVTSCVRLTILSLSDEVNTTVGGGLYFMAYEAEVVLLVPPRSSKVFDAIETSTNTSEEVGETVKE